jgi:TonB family protein
MTIWQEWEGRIVSGNWPLQQCLDFSNDSALYLTTRNGNAAAIRLLRADAPSAEAQVASWKLASGLSHPHLVRVFDTGVWHADEELDLHFAVMEYCEESLAEVLRGRSLTPDEARAMLAPTLDALQYLHGQGVVQGHLSPAAILAQGDQVKLSTSDLRPSGEARRASTADAYDPPEKTAASFSGDIWSLGVTLCQALTRQLPARDHDGALRTPENLPAPFDTIVKQCLATNSESRISIAGIRKLLAPPALELQPKPEASAKPAPVEVVATRPASASAAAKDSSEAAVAPSFPQRWHIFAGAAGLLVLLAILIGVRATQRPSEDATSSAPVATTAEPPAPHSSASTATKPGAVLQQVMPDILPKARATIRGTVKVKVHVTVNPQGQVTGAKLDAKSDSTYFATKALEAARHWRFSAPVRDGRPQSAEWTVHFEFRNSGTHATAQMSSAG